MTHGMTLRLNGTFALTAASGDPVHLASQRAQALLAILARAPERTVARGELAHLLWGDRPEEQARASLRQELSALRRSLAPCGPDILTADRLTVSLSTQNVTLEPGPGSLLAGIDIRSEPFEDWLRAARMDTDAPTPDANPVVPPTHRNPILAVLPFSDLAQADDFFADGVVEEITGALARVREFDVIARQSSAAIDRAHLDIPAIATALGADYLIEGSVRRAGSRVRISVHLLSGADGRVLWDQRYDDALDDLFDLQDRIASQIAGTLAPHLRAAEIMRAKTSPPASRSAYDNVLMAYPHFWAHRQSDNQTAIGLLSDAIERDPDYAPALALKAWAVGQQPVYMWSQDPVADRALGLQLAGQAIEKVGDHAPTLTAIAAAISQCSTDLDRSDHYIDRALSIDPNNAWAWMRRAWNGSFSGNLDQALTCFDRAERLSPLDPLRFNCTLGRASTFIRWTNKYTEALRLIEDAFRQNPGAVWALRMRVAAHFRMGDHDNATRAAQDLLSHYPHVTVSYLRMTLPPMSVVAQPDYFDAFLAAGIPEGTPA